MPARNDRDPSTKNSEANTTTPQRPKWGRRFGILLVALVAIAYLLPTIACNTSLKDRLIGWGTQDLEGKLTVDQLSVGWFAPIKASGVKLLDNNGVVVVDVGAIETQKTLTQLLCATNDYGDVRIDKPQLNLSLERDSSNLENVLSKWMSVSPSNEKHRPTPNNTSEPNSLPKVQAIISGGSIVIASGDRPPVRLEKIQATVQVAEEEAPLRLQVKSAGATANRLGSLELLARIDAGKQKITGSHIEANVQVSGFPIACLTPALERFFGETIADGTVTGGIGLNADLVREKYELTLAGVDFSELDLIAPELIGKDRVSVQRVLGSGNVSLHRRAVSAEQFKMESDFGWVSVDGDFDLHQLLELAEKGQLPRTAFSLNGRLELAPLFNMLPDTIGLKEGVVVRSGIVSLESGTQLIGGQNRLIFNLDTLNMNAEAQGQSIIWHQPLRIVGALAQSNNRLLLENLSCESEFLNIRGNASREKGNFTIDGDLEKLVAQVGQLIELPTEELAGKLNGRINWNVPKTEPTLESTATQSLPIHLGGQFVVTNPVVHLTGFQRWAVNQARIDVNTVCRPALDGVVAVENGKVVARVGNEIAAGTLRKPIPNAALMKSLQMDCTVSGEINRWLAHLRRIVDIDSEIASAGSMTSTFILTATSDLLRINNLKLDAETFRFRGYGMDVAEPKVVCRGNIRIPLPEATIQIVNGSVAGNSMAANLEQMHVSFAPALRLDGNTVFQAALNRVSQWWGFCQPADEWVWTGITDGQAQFSNKNNRLEGAVQLDIKEAVVLQSQQVAQVEQGTSPVRVVAAESPFEEVWREENAKFQSNFVIADNYDEIRISKTRLDSKLAKIQAHGVLSDLANLLQTELSGNWLLDWNQVNPLINSSTELASFQGNAWQPFEIKGPLFKATSDSTPSWLNPNLNVRTGIKWQTASILQLPLDPSQVNLAVQQSSTVMQSPSEGLVGSLMRLSPTIQLMGDEPVMTVQQGVILDSLNLTAEYVQDWLKYVAPMVAETTSAQGVVSVRTGGATVPLMEPMNASARGAFIVEDVVIGPGPMTRELLPLLDQVAALIKPGSKSLSQKQQWLRLQPQEIPFAVQDGRVYHRGLRFEYDDVLIETTGNVGFDQTMELVASIPIRDEWIADQPLLQGMRGQSLSIPIRGTLTQPQLDRRAIAQLTNGLLKRTASTALNKAVGDEVNGLQNKLNGKVNRELNRVTDQLRNNLQNESGNLGENLENELFQGINRLFKGKDR